MYELLETLVYMYDLHSIRLFTLMYKTKSMPALYFTRRSLGRV